MTDAPRHVFLQSRRQHVQQPRDRLVEREARYHRRHHCAHAGVGIGLGAGGEAFGRWLRELDRQVVAGRAALHQHLQGADVGGQILVLGGAVAADPRCSGEQEFERPAVAHTFAEVSVAVRVGIDEPWMNQPVAGIDHSGIGWGSETRRADPGDAVTVDQDVGLRGAMTRDVKHAPIANHRHAFACHVRTLSHNAIPADQGKMRSIATTFWKGTMPMIDKISSAPTQTIPRKRLSKFALPSLRTSGQERRCGRSRSDLCASSGPALG